MSLPKGDKRDDSVAILDPSSDGCTVIVSLFFVFSRSDMVILPQHIQDAAASFTIVGLIIATEGGEVRQNVNKLWPRGSQGIVCELG